MAFSSVGRKKTAAHVFIFLVNIVVLAFAARVNEFQEYFFVADLFPLALSIITFVFLGLMLLMDLVKENSLIGYPQVEIGVFSVLSIFWLCFNAFSSSRWSQVPMNCSQISEDFPDVLGWCHDLNGLKAMVWIEFLAIFLTTVFTLKFAVSQSSKGNKHIWKGPLSRYESNNNQTQFTNAYGNSHMSWQATNAAGYPFQGEGNYHHGNAALNYNYGTNTFEKAQ